MAQASPTQRLLGAAIASAALALLLVAASLKPSAEGIGTHTQLGLQRCAWHIKHGYVCPSCGMTTSFALATDGRLFAAFQTQPAGTAFAMLTAMAVWIGGYVALTGAPLLSWIAHTIRPRTAILIALAIVLAGWGYLLIVR